MVHSKAEENVKDAAIDFVAGSLGAIGLVYVGQPLDTIKVKMQTFPSQYVGMMHCLKETFLKEGVRRGLYAGTVPAIVANVAENSVLFAGYGACQKAIAQVTSKKPEQLGMWENASAGFLASFFSSFTLCPTELVKCRLQALREKQEQARARGEVTVERVGPLQLTRNILRQEGPAGFFRGLSSTFAREMPGYFFFFGGYEATRDFFTPYGGNKNDIGPLKTMIAGAMGGAMFWIATFPFDVVKSRIQVSGLQVSMVSLLMTIFRKEGIMALYNGLRPTLVRTVPASATLFVVYEYSKHFMHSLLD